MLSPSRKQSFDGQFDPIVQLFEAKLRIDAVVNMA